MRRWKLLLGSIAVMAVFAVTARMVVPGLRGVRGVLLLPRPGAVKQRGFDRTQSAALFVGVRNFAKGRVVEVKFAADDAVDLAYLFALDPRVRLVPPERVVLALSGQPQKSESKKRLEELRQAGAKIEGAEVSDILLLLQRQAAAAGPDGILIVSLATHGFVRDGVPYVLGSGSLFQYEGTSLPMPRMFELAATSDARRSLFLIDACRERITGDSRGAPDPATAAPFVERMGRVAGQVVFSAAAAGGYAYDRPDGNGVFTRAVIDGLRCKARLTRGAVTFETLRPFVERSVRAWIREHRDPSIRSATQASIDGEAGKMPLSMCVGPLLPPPPGNVARVEYEGSSVTAFSADGTRLWQRDLNAPVLRAEVADLDADGSRDVVVGADEVIVFDRTGTRRWSAKEGTLRELLVADMLPNGPVLQIVAMWDDGRSSSRVSMYAADGQRLSAYGHPGRLTHMAIDRPTSHHGRRIILAGVDARAHPAVLLLDSKSRRLWGGLLSPSAERIARIAVVDHDNDSKRDIAITTVSGRTLVLDFTGRAQESLGRLKFESLP